jgi:hypothetical protein
VAQSVRISCINKADRFNPWERITQLPPAGDDPLHLLAHPIAGLATLLALMVDYLVTWAELLRERHGPAYATNLPTPVVP